MLKHLATTIIVTGSLTTAAHAGDFNAEAAHKAFIDAFNNRQWDAVKSVLTDDSVFHRAVGDEVFIGPDAIIERFSSTIGAADQWNVKFVRLDSTSHMAGNDNDNRVVERGDFAVTAGADDSTCYAGSYMMTWMPLESGDWGLQVFGWQDVETDISTCQ